MHTFQPQNSFGKLPAVGLESAHEPTEKPSSKAKSIADTNTSNYHQSEIKFKSHFEESDNESEISETSIYSETENEPDWLLPILYIIEILYPLFMFFVFKPVDDGRVEADERFTFNVTLVNPLDMISNNPFFDITIYDDDGKELMMMMMN